MKTPHSSLSVVEIVDCRRLEIPFVATCSQLCLEGKSVKVHEICAAGSAVSVEVQVDGGRQHEREAELSVEVEVTFVLRLKDGSSRVCRERFCFERSVDLKFPLGSQLNWSSQVVLGDCSLCLTPGKHKTAVVTCPATLCLELVVTHTKVVCAPVLGPCPYPYFPVCPDQPVCFPACKPDHPCDLSGSHGEDSGDLSC